MDVEAKAAAPPSTVADLLHRNGGKVSDIDFSVLEKILSQCTVGELRQVEKSSGGRDLSPVTEELWRKFYEQKFGPLRTDAASKRMKKENVRYRWMELYDSKEKEELDEAETKAAERLKRRYKEEALRKQSRRVVICKETEVPSLSWNKRKRSEDNEVPSSSSNKGSNTGSSCGGDDGPVRKRRESWIMKKARKDFLNCIEVKNITAMGMVKLQKGYSSKKDLTLKRCAVLAEEY